MTPEHFLFIPTVFFLGFFFGGMFSQRNRHANESSSENGVIELASPATSVYALGISFLTFASIFVATHMLPLFGGAKALHLILQGKHLFDQRPSFTSSEIYQRLNDYGELGRAMYQRFTYSVDVVFPISFLVFLLVLNRFVGERTTLSQLTRRRLMALPAIWFASDMIENAIVFSLIAQFPGRNEFLSGILGFVTIAKFGLLLLSIMVPAIGSVLFRKKKGI